MQDFITITNDGENVTSLMPTPESVVEVKLDDGRIIHAVYDECMSEAGEWDFGPVDENDIPVDGDSIARIVVAWRNIQ